MTLHIQQGLMEVGFIVPMAKLCRWFEVHRRTVCYKPVKSTPKTQERFADPVKQMIEAEASFGYRPVARLLQFNKNMVQRIFQFKGCQDRKRAIGHRLRIEALSSVATTPNERWATDLCRVRRAVMAGRPWPSSSTATRESCAGGSFRDVVERQR